MRVHIFPSFGGEDDGDGGIRRVVEAQQEFLPADGVELEEMAAGADLIACHISAPSTYVKLYPRTPLVAMCHGLYWAEYDWPNWALKANVEVMELLRIADAITAPSEWVAQVIRRHTSRPVTVIPHGVRMEEWEPDPAPERYVLWNKTRPDPVCDPMPVVQVANRMSNTVFITTFAPPSDKPRNLVEVGRQPYEKGKALVRKAGVYLATAKETFGIGTLEALAAGVPVVGFAHGGQTEIIEHGRDGWLVHPGDIDGLAEGIRWAFGNRSQISPLAQEKARRYSWERAAGMYASLFEGVLANQKRQHGRPKVSIIVTAYMLEKYLPDTLRSVREQTFENWECIVVDDASPDHCGEIARLMAEADPRFRVIRNQTNRYLAGARNVGIEAAQGEYILPLDADDMITPRTLEILVQALDGDRTIHIAYGGVFFVNEDGRTPTEYGTSHGPGRSGWPLPFNFEAQAKGRNYLPYCSMFRRRVWQETGGYRERCRTAEDADFWLRASSYGFRPAMVTGEDTLVYRNREGSMSRREGSPEGWNRWYPWGADLALAPAGAVTKEQQPIPSYDPPAVSVIIPVGPGHEAIVQDALDSVQAQSYRGYEVILVNDTGAVLPAIPAWVRVIATGGRRGVAYARNRGIEASRADYFLPLDADDLLEPDALMWMLTAAEMHPGEIIYSDFFEDPHERNHFRIYETLDYDPLILTQKGALHPVTALTPKSAWEAAGGYDEDMPCWEDWAFALAVLDKGYCSRRIRAPLFTYRKFTGARREANQVDFDRCKAGILSRFGKFWNGSKDIMSCGCSTKPTVQPPESAGAYAASRMAPAGAVMVQYIGGKEGEIGYRGQQTTYTFAAHEPPRWVAAIDVELFRRRQDFVVLDGIAPQDGEEGASPTLFAPGPPVAAHAAVSPHAGFEPMDAVARMGLAPSGATALAERPPAAGLRADESLDSGEPDFPMPQVAADDGRTIADVDPETAIAALRSMGLSREEAMERLRNQ